MPKFEINNPEALKLIEDIKSGVLFKPYLEKIKKLKTVFIGVGIFLFFLIFILIGKSLSNRAKDFGYIPPNLEILTEPTAPTVNSPYNSLKEEIFLFSTDLPDPIIPDLNNTIDLKEQAF
ncbi:hypothetical protein A2572_04620 [Candidatus Collierbacteria bacterium RIFOXYD1_FULL_40_9]|uniref:Uncharacterized protein n=1 Tax=Candidatus Collierbacteria bacterium RIFOXYD1_FULL_40_9 TaxID=1817731 RepID=A0A1F5FUN3_9BACT|nr:MAG: hypothetical protein A2572_04620 [Candidatus Collierbacteria bacterium RIFOXYD1_FULL_40_9]